MMCDTNWCTFCDNAISAYSDSLYCSEDCLKQDALMNHPMLGYNYSELKGFPHFQQKEEMPSLVRRKTSIPTMTNHLSSTSSTTNNHDYMNNLQKIPSLSSSISSLNSEKDQPNYYPSTAGCFQSKPRRSSTETTSFMDQLNKAFLYS